MNRKVAVAVVAAAFLVGAGGWFWLGRRTPPPKWVTQEVKRGDVVQVVNATGTLQPVVLSPVGAQVSGIVWKLHADYNDLVKKGQVLVELDPALFNSAVAQAEANLASARADVLKAQADLTNASLAARRALALFDKAFIAAADRDAAVATEAGAKATLAGTEARVKQAAAALSKVQLDLKNSVILSPVDGMVISRNVELGQAVVSSFQAPNIYTIAQDLKKMQVLANVDEADIGMVQVGQTAEFTVDAFRGKKFSAKVSQVRDAAQTVQNVVTYVVVLDVDNSDLLLRPTMTANVRMEVARREGVVLVPNAALRFKPPTESIAGRAGGGHGGKGGEHGGKGRDREKEKERDKDVFSGRGLTYVEEGEHLKAVPVATGITDGMVTEARNGLSEGQQVVVDMARQGAPVAGPPSTNPMMGGQQQQRGGGFRRGGI